MTLAFLGLTAAPWAMSKHALRELARTSLADVRLTAEAEEAARTAWSKGLVNVAGVSARTLENGSGRAAVVDGVACIPVVGPIFPRDNFMTRYFGATSVTGLQRDVSAALADEGVTALLLVVDSPGGAVSGVNALADQIYAARGMKPTAAHGCGTVASGAYWIAAQAERLTIERTGIVGSIGVVVGMPKQVEPDGAGDMWFDIVSSNAPNKRPDPSTEEGTAEVVATLDAIEAQFVADVARGRGVDAERVTGEFGRGGTKVGPDAEKAGMVDGVASLDAALSRMARVGKQFRKGQQAAR